MAKSSFFKDGGSGSNVAATIQSQVDAAAASAAAAANTFNSIGNELTLAQAARTASETARDASIAAKTQSESARDTATQQANNAATSASNASASEGNAATSETNSAASQSAAATSEGNASTSAGNAATSAAASQTAQTASETARDASVVAKTASETARDASVVAKTASETARDASVVAKTASETAKTASEAARDLALSYRNTAETHKNDATTQAGVATTQAGIATTQAGTAATQAGNASTSATSAATAQAAAEAARDSALAALDNFDDRFLGNKSSDVTVDNDGDALVAGALYYNTTDNVMKVYTGSAWVAAFVSGGSFAALSGATFTGDVTVPNLITSGNVDGRDVSADGTKLDGIEASATADQTASEIRTLVESATDSNVFTDADHSKLNGIAAGATAVSSLTDLGISDGTNGQVLQTNGSGSFSFADAGGGGATQDADGDTKIQVEESTDDDTIRFDTAGSERAIISSNGNIGIATTDLGFESLTIQKVGSSSYGSIQLRRSDTDGTSNGGIFTFAQKDDCSTSWLGFAGWDNGSLRQVYIGGGNWGTEEATKVNIYAGAYDAGSNGAALKASFDASAITLSENTHVDADGVALKVNSTNDNTFKIGMEDSGTVRGYLGANSSVCFYAGNSSGNGKFFVSTNGSEVKQISGANNAYYRFYANGADRNYLYQSGASEIGFLTSAGNWAFKCDNSGNVTATGNVTAYSDIRLKDDIQPIEGALERVSKLEGVEYTRKSTGKREIGFIAQNVIDHEPTLVDVVDTSTDHTDEAFTDLHVMKYQNTVALLVEAIKELKAEVAELRAGCCHGASE